MVRLLAVILMTWGSACMAAPLPELIPLDKPLPTPVPTPVLPIVTGEEGLNRVRAHLAEIMADDVSTTKTIIRKVKPDFHYGPVSEKIVYTEVLPGVVLVGNGAINLAAIGTHVPSLLTVEGEIANGTHTYNWYDAELNRMRESDIQYRWGKPPSPTEGLAAYRLPMAIFLFRLENLVTLHGIGLAIRDTESDRSLIHPRFIGAPQSPGLRVRQEFGLVPSRVVPVHLDATFIMGEPQSFLIPVRDGEVVQLEDMIIIVAKSRSVLNRGAFGEKVTRMYEDPENPNDRGALLAVYPFGASSRLKIRDPNDEQRRDVNQRMPEIIGTMMIIPIPIRQEVQSLAIDVYPAPVTARFKLDRIPLYPAEHKGVTNPWEIVLPVVPPEPRLYFEEFLQFATGYELWSNVGRPPDPNPPTGPITLGDLMIHMMQYYKPTSGIRVDHARRRIDLGPPPPNFAERALQEMLR